MGKAFGERADFIPNRIAIRHREGAESSVTLKPSLAKNKNKQKTYGLLLVGLIEDIMAKKG